MGSREREATACHLEVSVGQESLGEWERGYYIFFFFFFFS